MGETEPFISELLTGLTAIIQDLETHQIHMFYETVGLMIGAETNPDKREEYLVSESPKPSSPALDTKVLTPVEARELNGAHQKTVHISCTATVAVASFFTGRAM